MKRFKIGLICIFAFGFELLASANIYYVAQNAQGTGNGSSVANANALSSFNPAVLLPGDTLNLVGKITSQLTLNSLAGSPGNPITIYWQPGAALSQPAGTMIICVNTHYLLFDGGTNGIIENTDNGSALDNQVAESGIYASGSDNLEVRNLTFQNFFIPSGNPNSLTNLPFSSNGALYMNGFGSNISVHNNSFSNICWVLNLLSGWGGNINIYSNNFVNYDHGIAGLGNSCSNVSIFNNHFGSTACWDSGTNNYYHHDGIHIFFYGTGVNLNGAKIYNNLFDGNWGSNNTAHFFYEGDDKPNCISNVTVFNNVFIQYPGCILNDGFAGGSLGPNFAWYNNTFVGMNVNNSSGVGVGNTNIIFVNNLISSVNTFVSSFQTNSAFFSNNIYADWGHGGNSPWYNGSAGGAINSFSVWQASIGSDYNSKFTTASGVVNSDGTIPTGSPAINAGANLSSIFKTDYAGNLRPSSPGLWTVGAYQVSATTVTNAPSTIVVTPPVGAFGVVPIGITTNEVLTVQNMGPGIVTGGVTATLPYNIVSGGSYTLTTGQTQAVTISFSPTAVGHDVETVTFSGGTGTNVLLTGVGGQISPPQNLNANPP